MRIHTACLMMAIGSGTMMVHALHGNNHQQENQKIEKKTNTDTLERALNAQLREFEKADGKRRSFLRKMLENLCQEAERLEYKSFRLQGILESARRALGRK